MIVDGKYKPTEHRASPALSVEQNTLHVEMIGELDRRSSTSDSLISSSVPIPFELRGARGSVN